jgi:Protein of unknown function (DUF2950)
MAYGKRETMVEANRNYLCATPRWCVAVLSFAAALAWAAASTSAVAADTEQQTFASPQQAVEALAAAVRAGATDQLLHLFGPQGDKLVRSGDPIADKEARERFMTAYAKANKIVMETGDKALLVIGGRAWPFPIPIVKQGGVWQFDTAAGEQEILDRRIGHNELSAIKVCRAYVDAQREYASQDRNGDGLLEYASRFRSSPGKRDGLYWPVGASEQMSPLGPLMVSAQAEGYGTQSASEHKREPYHGYYYRILTRQGKDAPGGAYDYMVRGHMLGGFALVAFPAKYGVLGVMTFIVNQDGVIYQKDLGPDTATIARRMTEFDTDKTWKTP